MAEDAPAPAAAAPAKAKKTKKPAAKVQKKVGPSVTEMIRSGMSVPVLKKALAGKCYDVEKNNSRVNTAIKGLVGKGTLVQTKGVGASGSFKLNKEAKAKKPIANKPTDKKAPTAKKATPKKAKKPVAAKKTPPPDP
ncbi:hypothetical protein CRUP_022977 [Coryphaenoides rupestris]|nr:hypothetical protein CRUP_022977 [Coryphaenoides rupestris]